MTQAVEATVRIADLKEFKELLRCVGELLNVYERMGHHLADGELIEAMETLSMAIRNLRDA